jgi:lysine-specific permease
LGSCFIGCLAFLTSLFGSGVVFNWLTNLTSVAGLITWVIISITHLRFRKGLLSQGYNLKSLPYVSKLHPFCDIFSIVIGTVVIFGQGYKTFTTDPIDARNVIAAYIGLIFGVALYFGHKVIRRPAFVKLHEMDFETGRLSRKEEEEDENDGMFDENGDPIPRWKRYYRKFINIIA